MTMKQQEPNFRLRDLAGVVGILLLAVALVVAAFLSHAGPFILIAVLILLIFGLLRHFRERGREAEAQEVVRALRSRLHKGERLQAWTIGDRRRFKPLATLGDMTLALFSQGLAAQGSSALATDDTFIGLTDRRLLAITRQKLAPGERRGWLERLNLRRQDESRGRHAIVFEVPREGLVLAMRLAVFHMARLEMRASNGKKYSSGLNSRYWAEQAFRLTRALDGDTSGSGEAGEAGGM
jgi:hypothetical protein